MARRGLLMTVMALITGVVLAPTGAAARTYSGYGPSSGTAAASVLRVGTYDGIPGQFASIQAAVDAARPGDWILVGPGDYKTTSSEEPPGQTANPAGILITTPGIYLRGMDRNAVVVDGTRPGSPQCSSRAADQNYGPAGPGGPTGLNGIVVWKAADVWVQNMTVCNFLGGQGGDEDTGNEVWWDGGHGSGQVGGVGSFNGSYLTATSDFYDNETTAAEYGIYSSNWSGGAGGGLFDHDYASNFNDSGFYIGACQQICDQTIDHAWSENNALGYSGTNSGGQLVVEHSQFDHNEDGFDTNSQNADFPPPMNGDCPNGGVSPITHTHSCWVFIHNDVHDNNNPNVPTAGSAAAGPVGTGMSVAGARNVTVMDNLFQNNGAWGAIFVPYPDSGPPCTGGTGGTLGAPCIYDEYGDALIDNRYSNNGFFGNPTNGDFGAANFEPGPTDCYRGNVELNGSPATSSPSNLQSMYPECTGQTVPPNLNPQFVQEVSCDSTISLAGAPGNATCLPTDHYPRQTQVTLAPLPSGLPSMDACAGVPANPWCAGTATTVRSCSANRISLPLSLAPRESFVSLAVKVGRRRAVVHRARGRRAVARFSLGRGRRRPVRVRITERFRVRHHVETTTLRRTYQVCGATGAGARW